MNLVVFGANGSIGEQLVIHLGKSHEIYSVPGPVSGGPDLCANDFCFSSILDKLPSKIRGVIFAQGINPSKGLGDCTHDHFHRMLNINIVNPTKIIQGMHAHDILADNCPLIFFGTTAEKKGSWDPAYGSAKSAIHGLMTSINRHIPTSRPCMLRLGLVAGTKVEREMTRDFRERHLSNMSGRLVNIRSIKGAIDLILDNECYSNCVIDIDRGTSV